MTDELGLDALTDDQLVELARAIAAEIGRRGAVVYDAARDATVEARAAQEGAQAAADRAWATQWSEWARAKRAALMIRETLGPGWRFAAWRSRQGERRVYLESVDARPPRTRPSDAIRAHHGRPPRPGAQPSPDKICLYVDGGSRAAPGHLEVEGAAQGADRARIEAIVRFIAASWDERGGMPIETALMTDITPAPSPPYYA